MSSASASATPRSTAKRPRHSHAAATAGAEPATKRHQTQQGGQQHQSDGAGEEEEHTDPTWSTLYAPLPAALQPGDHTGSLASSAASASLAAHISSASASVGASASSYIPSLVASLLPNATQFEVNWNTKLREKNVMMENSIKGKEGFNLGDSTAKLARKRRKKRGIQMMSSNQRKAAGLTQIPKGDLKYTMFLPLHQLWVAYMHDILDRGNSRGLSMGERMLKADYHGAIFTVIRCRSPTHIGHRGIMILETQETFQILNESNALKILPKKHTVFAVTVPPTTGMGRENESDAMIDAPSSSPSSASSSSSPPQPPKVFELFGDHLCFRSYERSARKFKAKPTIQL